MGKYFGTDGFRGRVNEELTADHAFRIGRFLGYYYAEKHGDGRAKIVIGKDTRLSGYMLEYCLAGGITASGCDAYLLHVTTTPCTAFVAKNEGFDCGIMISASHNPYYDNGIKLINSDGEKMEDRVIDLLEEYLDSDRVLPFAEGEGIGKTVDFVAGRNRYIAYLISLATHSFRGVKVGLDCANGSAWSIGRAVFEALGATVTVIGAEPKGTNINDGCGSTHIENLQSLVREKSLDVGFAFDGDADRCICVDERGEVVDGDAILYMAARYLKKKEELEGEVVTTVMSNFGLYKAFDSLGIPYAKTDVGDRFVYQYMKEHACAVGGEQSGHVIFSKYASTGDGLLTSLKVMEILLSEKEKLSDLTKGLTVYPQKTVNVRVEDKAKVLSDTAVQQKAREVETLLGDKGRLLLRPSGTEPVVRIMVEAESLELCERCCEAINSAIAQMKNE